MIRFFESETARNETRLERLAGELYACFAEGKRLEKRIRKNLKGLGYE